MATSKDIARNLAASRAQARAQFVRQSAQFNPLPENFGGGDYADETENYQGGDSVMSDSTLTGSSLSDETLSDNYSDDVGQQDYAKAAQKPFSAGEVLSNTSQPTSVGKVDKGKEVEVLNNKQRGVNLSYSTGNLNVSNRVQELQSLAIETNILKEDTLAKLQQIAKRVNSEIGRIEKKIARIIKPNLITKLWLRMDGLIFMPITGIPVALITTWTKNAVELKSITQEVNTVKNQILAEFGDLAKNKIKSFKTILVGVPQKLAGFYIMQFFYNVLIWFLVLLMALFLLALIFGVMRSIYCQFYGRVIDFLTFSSICSDDSKPASIPPTGDSQTRPPAAN